MTYLPQHAAARPCFLQAPAAIRAKEKVARKCKGVLQVRFGTVLFLRNAKGSCTKVQFSEKNALLRTQFIRKGKEKNCTKVQLFASACGGTISSERKEKLHESAILRKERTASDAVYPEGQREELHESAIWKSQSWMAMREAYRRRICGAVSSHPLPQNAVSSAFGVTHPAAARGGASLLFAGSRSDPRKGESCTKVQRRVAGALRGGIISPERKGKLHESAILRKERAASDAVYPEGQREKLHESAAFRFCLRRNHFV